VGDSVVFSSVGGGLHSEQGQGGGQEGRIVLHLGWADQWRVCGTGRCGMSAKAVESVQN